MTEYISKDNVYKIIVNNVVNSEDGIEALNKTLTEIEGLPRANVIETGMIGNINVCGDINDFLKGRLCDDVDSFKRSILYAPITWGHGLQEKCAGVVTSVIGDKWFGTLSEDFLKFVPSYKLEDLNTVISISVKKGSEYFWR